MEESESTAVKKSNSEANQQNSDFDAEWEQFEAELQAPTVPPAENGAVSYPQFQSYDKADNAYSSSFQQREGQSEKDSETVEDDDDGAAYSPSSEPILDLFDDNNESGKPVESSALKETTPSKEQRRRDDESKSSRSKKRSRSKSRSRSRSKDRKHRSKRDRHHSSRDRHRHSRSRSRDRHSKRKRSSSSSSYSSRSRSRSSDDRRHRSHRSERSSDRRKRDDDRSKDSRRHKDDRTAAGLSSATVGNYGPRSAEQIEKQRQLNAAVLNQKQTTKRVGKNKHFNPNANRSGPPGEDDVSTGVSDQGPPEKPQSSLQSRKKIFDPKMTPQERAMALQKQVEEATGIQMPKYYNPSAINPLKYAEQMQKRKLLWSKAKEGKTENESLWQNTSKALDSSSSNKFQKLMGLKSSEEAAGPEPKQTSSISATVTDSRRKQDQLFDQLDREYEFARMATHTHRGMGLGFQSAAASFGSGTAQKK